jgi:hypothetical protein
MFFSMGFEAGDSSNQWRPIHCHQFRGVNVVLSLTRLPIRLRDFYWSHGGEATTSLISYSMHESLGQEGLASAAKTSISMIYLDVIYGTLGK